MCSLIPPPRKYLYFLFLSGVGRTLLHFLFFSLSFPPSVRPSLPPSSSLSRPRLKGEGRRPRWIEPPLASLEGGRKENEERERGELGKEEEEAFRSLLRFFLFLPPPLRTHDLRGLGRGGGRRCFSSSSSSSSSSFRVVVSAAVRTCWKGRGSGKRKGRETEIVPPSLPRSCLLTDPLLLLLHHLSLSPPPSRRSPEERKNLLASERRRHCREF